MKGQTAHYILMLFNHIHAVKHLKKSKKKGLAARDMHVTISAIVG